RTGKGNERRGHKREDERKQNKTLRACDAGCTRAEVENVGAGNVELESIKVNHDSEREHEERKRRKPKASSSRGQNSEPHPEERRQENEVRKIAEVADVRRNPSNAA